MAILKSGNKIKRKQSNSPLPPNKRKKYDASPQQENEWKIKYKTLVAQRKLIEETTQKLKNSCLKQEQKFNELIEKLKKENSILKNGNSSNKHIEQIEKENASLKQQLSKLRLKEEQQAQKIANLESQLSKLSQSLQEKNNTLQQQLLEQNQQIEKLSDLISFYNTLTNIEVSPTPDQMTYICNYNSKDTKLEFSISATVQDTKLRYHPIGYYCKNEKKELKELPDYLGDDVRFNEEDIPQFLCRMLTSLNKL